MLLPALQVQAHAISSQSVPDKSLPGNGQHEPVSQQTLGQHSGIRPGVSVRLAQVIGSGGTFGDVIQAPKEPPFRYDAGKQGQFIVSLCPDRRGGFWVGTEDQGVWYCNPVAPEGKQWKQFTVKDGLGDDNAYAIVTDRLGRVWVGHMNHGVSVWNGQQWKKYGLLEGPLGERIFAMTTSPVDGDVWLATNAGLSRYSLKTDTWRHYTRAQGLPSQFATCLAFDSLGTLYVGTQTEGIAIGHSDSDYRQWRVVRGPEVLPNAHSGQGLPGSLINDIVCSPEDVVYAATTRGLARSSDSGETWSYIRGIDWKDKLKGLLKPVEAQEGDLKSELLREDYISCLSLDAQGLLWIGYRQRGYELRDPRRDRVLYTSASNPQQQFPYVSAILPRFGSAPVLANYGEGLSQGVQMSRKGDADDGGGSDLSARLPAGEIPLPAAAPAPALAELTALLQEVAAVKPLDGKTPLVEALDDDWRTQGDWLGRYGRAWACLGAFNSPQDFLWGAGRPNVKYHARIGLNADKGDSIRYWVHWLYTDNRRSLEMPPVYFDSRLVRKMTTPEKSRRQSEMDDHGEEYPMTKDGPHLYFTLKVPEGLHYLSLYNFNKDGHSGHNRMRDYRISLRAHPGKQPLSATEDFSARPELANGRLRDFWGGVWKRYLVRGPKALTVEVSRNYSYNTILAGVFLDTLEEKPQPYFFKTTIAAPRPKMWAGLPVRDVSLNPAAQSDNGGLEESGAGEAEAASRLFEVLERVRGTNPSWWARESRRGYLALIRWYQAARLQTRPEEMASLNQRLGTCYFQVQMFEPWEALIQKQGLLTPREIEKALRWDRKGKPESGTNRQAIEAYLKANLDESGNLKKR
jgi:hypothetical protein